MITEAKETMYKEMLKLGNTPSMDFMEYYPYQAGRVFGKIARYANMKDGYGSCTASQERLAWELGIKDKKTVGKAIHFLEAQGLIRNVSPSKGGKQTDTYIVIFWRVQDEYEAWEECKYKMPPKITIVEEDGTEKVVEKKLKYMEWR
jgi:hypothetical protein